MTIRMKPDALIGRIFGDFAASYLLRDDDHGDARLIVKVKAVYPRVAGPILRLIMPAGDMIMMRRQLLNFKALSERAVAAATRST